MRLGVEVVDGLDETDAPDLKEIVDVLPPGGKALDDGQHEPQIARDQLFAADLSPCRDAQQRRRVVALSSTASFEVLTPQISTFPCIYSKTSSGKR